MLATQAQVASLESQAYLAKVLASELRQEAAKLAHQNTLPKQSAAEGARSFGSRRLISFLETTAWTIPEMKNPSASAQKISQNMANAMLNAWNSWCPM
jgi:hypothetical protein